VLLIVLVAIVVRGRFCFCQYIFSTNAHESNEILLAQIALVAGDGVDVAVCLTACFVII